MADVTETEKAYAAGLFDGEGCVLLYMRKSGSDFPRKDNALRAHLNVANTDTRPLFWLQERYGGTFHVDERDVHRPVVSWRIYSNQADIFANDIRPYLQIKGEQLDLWMTARAMMYRRGWRGGGLPEDEIAVRRDLVRKVAELKRVG